MDYLRDSSALEELYIDVRMVAPALEVSVSFVKAHHPHIQMLELLEYYDEVDEETASIVSECRRLVESELGDELKVVLLKRFYVKMANGVSGSWGPTAEASCQCRSPWMAHPWSLPDDHALWYGQWRDIRMGPLEDL